MYRHVSGRRNAALCKLRTELAHLMGSHHIYVKEGIPDQVNLQERKGKAKPYQVKQFLKLVDKHELELTDGDE